MARILTYIGTGIISQGLNLLPNNTYEVSEKAYKYFLETFPKDFVESVDIVPNADIAQDILESTKTIKTRKPKVKSEAE